MINSIVPNVDAARLARMVEVSRELSSTNDLDTLLKLIISEAAALTNAEAASILLLDRYTRELTPAQKARFLARIGTRALHLSQRND